MEKFVITDTEKIEITRQCDEFIKSSREQIIEWKDRIDNVLKIEMIFRNQLIALFQSAIDNLETEIKKSENLNRIVNKN
jgi:hypothetical protein